MAAARITPKITLASEKGGTGKSTVCVNLATAAAEAGVQVNILDVDPQRTAWAWSNWRAQHSPKASLTVQDATTRDLEAKVRAARARADLIFFDTPGKKGVETDYAAGMSNIVLVIVQPSMIDLVTLSDTYSLGGVTSRPAFVIFNRVPSIRIFDKACNALPTQYNVCPHYLSDAEIFRSAMAAGLGVVEMSGKSKQLIDAAAQVRNLWGWVKDRLDDFPRVPKPPGDDDIFRSIGGGR